MKTSWCSSVGADNATKLVVSCGSSSCLGTHEMLKGQKSVWCHILFSALHFVVSQIVKKTNEVDGASFFL